MKNSVEQEWKGRMMPEAQRIYDTIPHTSGSILARMITAQFVTERSVFSEEGGQYSLKAERGFALESVRDTNHMDMMGVDEHTWRVLRRTPPHLRNLVPGINKCLSSCVGNEELKEVVRVLYAR